MEVGAKLARTLETAHGWCISQYAASVARTNPEARAAVEWVNSGVSISVGLSPFSFAVGLGMDAPITTAELDQIEEFFRSRSLPPRIDICPFTDPGLLPLLQQRGYIAAEVTSVLALDLANDIPLASTPGIALRFSSDERDCGLWVDILAKCFFSSDPGARARTRMAALFRVPNSMNVIAKVEGEIAGMSGGMIPEDCSVAALFGSSVLPQFRNRGVHAAMLHFRIGHAKALGCRMAVASATPGTVSERNLIRCGFVPCYEKISYTAPGDKAVVTGAG